MFNDIVAKRLHQSKHVLCFVNEIEKIDATAGITEGVFRGFCVVQRPHTILYYFFARSI